MLGLRWVLPFLGLAFVSTLSGCPKQAELWVEPATLDFGETATEFPLALRNLGDEKMEWTASADKPWLLISDSGGTDEATIIVYADRAYLADGENTGNIVITLRNGKANTVTISARAVKVVPPLEGEPPVEGETPANYDVSAYLPLAVGNWWKLEKGGTTGMVTVSEKLAVNGFDVWKFDAVTTTDGVQSSQTLYVVTVDDYVYYSLSADNLNALPAVTSLTKLVPSDLTPRTLGTGARLAGGALSSFLPIHTGSNSVGDVVLADFGVGDQADCVAYQSGTDPNWTSQIILGRGVGLLFFSSLPLKEYHLE